MGVGVRGVKSGGEANIANLEGFFCSHMPNKGYPIQFNQAESPQIPVSSEIRALGGFLGPISTLGAGIVQTPKYPDFHSRTHGFPEKGSKRGPPILGRGVP